MSKIRVIRNEYGKINRNLLFGERDRMTSRQKYVEYAKPYEFIAKHRSPKIRVCKSK